MYCSCLHKTELLCALLQSINYFYLFFVEDCNVLWLTVQGVTVQLGT